MNRTWVSFGGIICVFIIGYFVFTQFFGLVRVAGASMSPSLEDGQIKVMRKTQEVERGEIILFNTGDYHYINRVIGLPGDQLELKGGRVYLNGSLLEERYLGKLDLLEITPFVVPKDHLFVLGDDRKESTDSRHLGFIPIKKVKGIILQ